MRGQKELPDSKIRIMVINKLEYNQKLRYRHIKLNFKDVHLWADNVAAHEAVIVSKLHKKFKMPIESVN